MRALTQRKQSEPEGATGDENPDTGAGVIDDDRRNNDRECDEPKDPPLSSFANVILAAGKNDDGGETENIGRLITIRKRTEAALVMPVWRRGFSEPTQNANRGEESNAGAEPAQCASRFV